MPLALSVAVQVAAEAKVRCDAQLSHGVVFLSGALRQPQTAFALFVPLRWTLLTCDSRRLLRFHSSAFLPWSVFAADYPCR